MEEFYFVSKPPHCLKCCICLEVAKQPLQHDACGSLFCGSCIRKHGTSKSCPYCRREEPKYFKDTKSHREIMDLDIKCPNFERGCSWEGTVGELKVHTIKCEYTPAPCPYECNHEELILKKDLETHLDSCCPNRPYRCKHCGEEGTYGSITTDHDSICEKKLIPCPNTGCSEVMERRRKRAHVGDECEFSEIECKYARLGCREKRMRKDIKAHENDNDKLHLHLALEKVMESTRVILKPKWKHSFNTSLTFCMPGYRSKKVNNEVFLSDEFYTSQRGYKMRAEIYPNGCNWYKNTHLSVKIRLLEGPYDNMLQWPFTGRVAIKLLNQSNDEHHIKKAWYWRCGGVDKWTESMDFVNHTTLTDSNEEVNYLVKDQLYFKVEAAADEYKPWLECTSPKN